MLATAVSAFPRVPLRGRLQMAVIIFVSKCYDEAIARMFMLRPLICRSVFKSAVDGLLAALIEFFFFLMMYTRLLFDELEIEFSSEIEHNPAFFHFETR